MVDDAFPDDDQLGSFPDESLIFELIDEELDEELDECCPFCGMPERDCYCYSEET